MTRKQKETFIPKEYIIASIKDKHTELNREFGNLLKNDSQTLGVYKKALETAKDEVFEILERDVRDQEELTEFCDGVKRIYEGFIKGEFAKGKRKGRAIANNLSMVKRKIREIQYTLEESFSLPEKIEKPQSIKETNKNLTGRELLIKELHGIEMDDDISTFFAERMEAFFQYGVEDFISRVKKSVFTGNISEEHLVFIVRLFKFLSLEIEEEFMSIDGDDLSFFKAQRLLQDSEIFKLIFKRNKGKYCGSSKNKEKILNIFTQEIISCMGLLESCHSTADFLEQTSGVNTLPNSLESLQEVFVSTPGNKLESDEKEYIKEQYASKVATQQIALGINSFKFGGKVVRTEEDVLKYIGVLEDQKLEKKEEQSTKKRVPSNPKQSRIPILTAVKKPKQPRIPILTAVKKVDRDPTEREKIIAKTPAPTIEDVEKTVTKKPVKQASFAIEADIQVTEKKADTTHTQDTSPTAPEEVSIPEVEVQKQVTPELAEEALEVLPKQPKQEETPSEKAKIDQHEDVIQSVRDVRKSLEGEVKNILSLELLISFREKLQAKVDTHISFLQNTYDSFDASITSLHSLEENLDEMTSPFLEAQRKISSEKTSIQMFLKSSKELSSERIYQLQDFYNELEKYDSLEKQFSDFRDELSDITQAISSIVRTYQDALRFLETGLSQQLMGIDPKQLLNIEIDSKIMELDISLLSLKIREIEEKERLIDSILDSISIAESLRDNLKKTLGIGKKKKKSKKLTQQNNKQVDIDLKNIPEISIEENETTKLHRIQVLQVLATAAPVPAKGPHFGKTLDKILKYTNLALGENSPIHGADTVDALSYLQALLEPFVTSYDIAHSQPPKKAIIENDKPKIIKWKWKNGTYFYALPKNTIGILSNDKDTVLSTKQEEDILQQVQLEKANGRKPTQKKK